MSQRLRSALRWALPLALLAGLPGAPPVAQTARERLGEMELSIDATSWRIERPAQHGLKLVPIGEMAKAAGTVVVTQASSRNLADCEAHARAQLSGFHYDSPTSAQIEVGGLPAVAMYAPTRCRNATPKGIAVCIPYRGMGYVLVNRIEGCRTGDGGNPFAGRDWFRGLLEGIRFTQ